MAASDRRDGFAQKRILISQLILLMKLPISDFFVLKRDVLQ